MKLADFVRKGTLHHREVPAAEIGACFKRATMLVSIATTRGPEETLEDAWEAVTLLAKAAVLAAGYAPAQKADDGVMLDALRRLLPDAREAIDVADEWRRRRALVQRGKSWPMDGGEASARRNAANALRESVLAWLRERRPDVFGA